jgi:hypothetical protein
MLVAFGLGIFIGIFIVIGLLKMTCQAEPTGCLILFGILCFLFCWGLAATWWIVFAG